MQTKFNYVKPSECNIDYHNLINYAKRLENQDIPMHSLIIMRGNNICKIGRASCREGVCLYV